MNKEKRKINKILMILNVVLIIIVVILLLKGCSKKEETIKNNGKINIFEIKCDTDCDCNCDKDNNEKDKEKDDNTQEAFKPIDDDQELDIKILDKNKSWNDNENINLFEDSEYVVSGKIAPESTGTYQFVIKNSTIYNVKYNLNFDERNNYNINMKYRLKKNNEYVINNWVTYSKLKQESIKLNKNSSDTYYLEWKWFESTNDNSIGEDINSKYGLSINIKAVQSND